MQQESSPPHEVEQSEEAGVSGGGSPSELRIDEELPGPSSAITGRTTSENNNNPNTEGAVASGGYSLHRESSSDSIGDPNAGYRIRFRSHVGSFEDHITYGFSNLYNSPTFSDITIACEGNLLKAHKMVLGFNSPYFRQMFEELKECNCQHPVLILHGIKLKDWQNVMRFVYTGEVTVNPSEIDDFISTMEGLKIDGLSEDHSSSIDDESPYDYTGRFPVPEFQLTEEQSQEDQPETVHYSQYSEDDYNRPRDYRYPRRSSPVADSNIGGYESDHEQPTSQTTHFLNRRLHSETANSRTRLSSTQSSPGMPLGSIRESEPENEFKSETHEGNYTRRTDSDVQRSPTETEVIRPSSQPSSPAERGGVRAVRHPVIARGARSASTSVTSEPTTEALELCTRPGPAPYTFSPRMSTSRIRLSPYSTVWDHRAALSSSSASSALDRSSQPCPTIIDREPPITTSTSLNSESTSHHFTTTTPPISRSQPAAGTIPLQMLSPGIPGYLSNRVTHLSLASTISSPEQSPTGVIASHSSPDTQNNNSLGFCIGQNSQSSTLAMLRAKLAAGQSIYTRGYRHHDRYNTTGLPGPTTTSAGPFSPTSSSISIFSPISSNTGRYTGAQSSNPGKSSATIVFGGVPRNASTEMASSAQHIYNENNMFGTSRSSLFQLPRHSAMSMSRPRTKAIRSSQVPQSARYTAAEVDAMVDKVQNFPGNQVPCAICQKFVKRERLRAHIHECHLLHGKRIECPYCGIGLKSKGSYRVHIWRHKKGTLPARAPQIPNLLQNNHQLQEPSESRNGSSRGREHDNNDHSDSSQSNSQS